MKNETGQEAIVLKDFKKNGVKVFCCFIAFILTQPGDKLCI